MANEITVSAKLSITKDGSTVTGDTSKSITLTGSGKYANTQNIGTSVEQISFPADLVTEGIGYVWLKNLDATNYVEISQNVSGTKHVYCKLKPGEVALVRTHKAATVDPDIWAQANTAAINLMVVATGT